MKKMMLKDKIISVMAENNLTQADIAEKMGVSVPTVSDWTKGASPRPAKLKKLNDYLDTFSLKSCLTQLNKTLTHIEEDIWDTSPKFTAKDIEEIEATISSIQGIPDISRGILRECDKILPLVQKADTKKLNTQTAINEIKRIISNLLNNTSLNSYSIHAKTPIKHLKSTTSEASSKVEIAQLKTRIHTLETTVKNHEEEIALLQEHVRLLLHHAKTIATEVPQKTQPAKGRLASELVKKARTTIQAKTLKKSYPHP